MESLQEILGKKRFVSPDEMSAVKNYILRRYKSPSSVKLERNALIVSVPNSSLAATLQLERQSLIKSCGIKKRLFIRTGR